MLIELFTCSFSLFGAADGCAGDDAQAKFSEVVAQYEIAANLPKGSGRQLVLLKEVHEQLEQIVADHPGSDVSKRIQSDDVAAITLSRIETRIRRFDPEFGVLVDATIVAANITSKPVEMPTSKLDSRKLEFAKDQPDQEIAGYLEPAATKPALTKINEVAEPFLTVLPQSKPTRKLAVVEDITKSEANSPNRRYTVVQMLLPTPKPDVVVSRAHPKYDISDAKMATLEPKASSTLYLKGPVDWSHMVPVGGQAKTSDWRGHFTPSLFRMNLVLRDQGTRVSYVADQAVTTNASHWNIRKLQNNDSAGIFLVSASQPIEVSQTGVVERDFRVVSFDFNSFEVRQVELWKLEAQVALVKSDPTLLIVIEGHADERGTREYNLALGEKRANQIRDYFVMQGIDPARIKTVSYGKERPLAKGSGKAVWAQNRRTQTVEFQGPKRATDNASVVANVQKPSDPSKTADDLPDDKAKIIFEEEIVPVVKAAAENSEAPEAAAAAELKRTALQRMTDAMRAAFPSVNISVSSGDNEKPEVAVSTVNALHESDDLEHTVFFQGAVRSHDGGDRTTVNAGVGYRRLVYDEAWLFGANLFFDHEFPADHQRASVGLEAKHSAMQLTANHYQAISNWKTHYGSPERALDGSDLELGVQVPYVPSAMLFTRAFKWNGVQGAGDLKGREHSLRFSGALGKGWVVEASFLDYQNRSDEQRITLTYSIRINDKTKSDESKVRLISNEIFETQSQKNNRLNEVRRSNQITRQAKTTIRYKGV